MKDEMLSKMYLYSSSSPHNRECHSTRGRERLICCNNIAIILLQYVLQKLKPVAIIIEK